MRVTEQQAADLVRRGARIRVHSGALGCEDIVMAEGKVISWCAAPSFTIEHDDGTRSSWSAALPIAEVEAVEWAKAKPYAIYRDWVQGSDKTSKSVWTAIQDAFAAGQATKNEP